MPPESTQYFPYLILEDFHLGASCSTGCPNFGASLVAQTIKNLPAMWKTQFQSLGGRDPLEKGMVGMVTHSSILAWRIP